MKQIDRVKKLILVALLLLATGCAVYAPAPYYYGGSYPYYYGYPSYGYYGYYGYRNYPYYGYRPYGY
jgi:hypothetical protein